MKTIRLAGEICKTEEQDDGTVLVSGYASSEVVDSHGEVVTAAAMKAALPEYMKFPAVREMHRSDGAAGTGLYAEVDKQGRTYFEALVVDEAAVKKVLTKVYRGFSIGAIVPPGGRDPLNSKVITKLNLKEISLVDRPANPEAVMTLAKLEDQAVDDEIQKDCYQIRNAASLIESLKSLIADTKAIGPQNSPVPGKLAGLAQDMISVLSTLVSQEAEEMAEIAADVAADGIAAADKTTAADPPEASDPPADTPAEPPADPPAAAVPADPPADVVVPPILPPEAQGILARLDKIEKAIAAVLGVDDAGEPITKAAQLEAENSKLRAQVDELSKAAPKGALKVVPIEKGDDNAADTPPETAIREEDTPREAIRKIHAGGRRVINAGAART
jgi:phage head maturation protease